MYHIPTFATRLHNYIRSTRITRKGALAKPGSAPYGTHKEYPRMSRTLLPAPETLPMSLSEALRTRTSCGACATERALGAGELGTLLGNALGMRDLTRRHYPSGGALYPVETYLIGKVLDTHPSGVFHYHPKAHALEFLWETPSSFRMSNVIRSPQVALTPLLIVFTSVWNRSSVKYGDLAYSHALIEAGHMAENLLLSATALSMGTRPIAGYDDGTLATLLDLDERNEQPIYSVLLCPSPEKGKNEGVFE
ncbi:MAG: SagB/ThcOx family dehydrogenase [Minisyncoccia bacterium]